MKNKIKVCSLFSGIGGFETGLFQSFGKENVEVVFASEIDKHASFAYEKIYGHKPEGDITKIHEKDIPKHDLLVGGFPCQAFSIAGKRLGFEDTRGTLFFDIARIAKEKQPQMLILENVKGLLSHNNGETIETIIKVLSDIGYSIDFTILNSKYFNVPQSRERVFFVGILNHSVEPWVIEKGNSVLNRTKKSLSELEGLKTFNFDFPKEENVTKVLKEVLEEKVPSKYFLNKERMEQLVIFDKEIENDIKKIGYIKNDKNQNRVHEIEGIMPTITANNQGGRRPGGLIADKRLSQIGYVNKNSQGNRVYSEEGISATIASQTGGVGGSGGGIYAIKEDLKHQIKEITRKSRPKEEISISFKENGDIRPHRNDKKKSGISELNINYEENTSFTVTSSHAPKIYGDSTNWQIRKLTPLECFRLQNFPDTYYFILREEKVSDSQLYKMAGNAVTTSVISAITSNIYQYFN